MNDYINTILDDYDAEFDLNSQSSELSSISQVMETPKLPNPRNKNQISNKTPRRAEQTSNFAINQHKNTIEHQEMEYNELHPIPKQRIPVQQNVPPKQDINKQPKAKAPQIPPPEPPSVLDNTRF